jgi:hypothetical protein
LLCRAIGSLGHRICSLGGAFFVRISAKGRGGGICDQ